LSRDAVRQQPGLDLIVWPESVYSGTLGEVLVDEPLVVPPDAPISEQRFRDTVQAWQIAVHDKNRDVATELNNLARNRARSSDGIWLIVGTDSQRLSAGDVQRYNSALLIDPQGNVASRYFKMHLVMFGEYIPLGRMFPLLYRITPIGAGLTPGSEPVAFVTPGATIAPSICFESTVPHLIRRQVAVLRQRGHAPDLLVNVTNDGWFWGSSILDLHLACGVFRAVENRLPFLVAANTGLSASIGQDGRIEQMGPRRAPAVLFSNANPTPRESLYHYWGDIPSWGCLLFCVAVSIVGAASAIRSRNLRKSPE
jgi:apolipoprotein N-acyltransferase